MDFPYDHTQYKWDHYFKPALKRYFELNGHTDIPQLFRIGHGDEKWPEKLWGFPLGVRVTNLRRRHRGEYTSQIEEDAEELAQLGFCHDSNLLEEQRYRQRVLLPLQIYLQKFGNLDVFTSFKVPDCPPWPKMAAGSKLGSAILNLRNRGDDAECVARDPEFKKLGFDWDPFTTELNERIFPASEIYKLENGHCKVPPDFIVTSTKPWPESLHGYKFGVAFAALRLRSGKFAFAARNVDQLTSVGLRMNVITREWDERVEPMLATFQELNGHRNAPIDFVGHRRLPGKPQIGGSSSAS